MIDSERGIPDRSVVEQDSEKNPIGRNRTPELWIRDQPHVCLSQNVCELTVTLPYMGPLSGVWIKRKTTAGRATMHVMIVI